MLQKESFDKLAVRNRQGLFVISLDEIIFIEKNLRKITIHTEEQQIEYYGKFSELIPHLDERFLWCHRSYIINMDDIVVMTGQSIFLTNNQPVFLGRDTFCKAKKLFESYLRKKRRIVS